MEKEESLIQFKAVSHLVRLLGVGLFSMGILMSCADSSVEIEPTEQDPDPVVVDFPIAYVKRPMPVDLDDNENESLVIEVLREPIDFNPGAQLVLRQRATPSAGELIITDQAFEEGALYDVKDVEVSYDGKRILFSMRAPQIEDLDPDEQPKWNIWEYDTESESLKRIITSDITAESGDDVSPHYLPDGKIVFSSNRQRISKAILLDEGKPQFSALDEDFNTEALNLHVMDADGSNINQITFNQSHDLDPTVLSNGQIVFSRWDNYRNDRISLYRINPDGTGLEVLYGINSHESGSDDTFIDFVEARQIDDGRLIVKIKPNQTTRLGGELVTIDWEGFVDNDTAVPNSVMTQSSGQVSATPYMVRSDDAASEGGRFADVYPLFDGTQRMLVSWTPCRLNAIDEQGAAIIVACTEALLNAENPDEANPLYGIWIYDPSTQTQLPIVTGVEGIVFHEVVALAPKNYPLVLSGVSQTGDIDLLTANVGVVHIRSVYDFDGVDMSGSGINVLADPMQTSAVQRPARFLKIVKAVSFPDRDVLRVPGTAFGRSGAQTMKEIIGYVPIEPDGSAKFTVPANIAFSLSVLDANGQRFFPRHQNWMTIKAGEVKECVGCHTRDSESAHGRYEAQAASINSGGAANLPFLNANPAILAENGETMAEAYSRIFGVRNPSVNIEFIDEWTDPGLREIDPPLSYSYSNLFTPSPTTIDCTAQWSSLCRITVNYPDHIQPIWDLPRQTFDEFENLIEDNTCTSCHSQTDAMGQVQIPAQQLELVGTISVDEPDHLTSYRELFFGDNEQEIIEGVLIDRLVQAVDGEGNPLFETDDEGNLVLDEEGNPIPVMVTVPVGASMNVNGALLNNDFYRLFANGGSHEGWLSEHELKLISEWLDIGAQYYNNPFAAPQ